MEDESIKDLFNNFQPELSSSFQFMTKLQKNMETVEFLKRHDAALKKRNKRAVVIAAFSGFLMGVIMTLVFPLVRDWVATFHISIPRLQVSAVTIDFSFVAWLLMAGICIITALNTYTIALAKLAPKGIDGQNAG